MGHHTTRAATAAGRIAGRLCRCCLGCAAIAATSLPAFAQVVTPGSNATTTSQLNVLTGTIDGGNTAASNATRNTDGSIRALNGYTQIIFARDNSRQFRISLLLRF